MISLLRLLALAFAVTIAGFCQGALAQPNVPNDAPIARANSGTVGVISGGIDGTYVRIAADLAAVLDDGQTLRVLPVLGKGSLQNLADILYLRGIDVGIVQSDVLAYAKQRNLYPGIDRSIQYIAKLYDEEIHVLARKDITRLEDLAGKPVNVDVSGSGTAMTASLLFEALGISVQTQNVDEPTAVEKLKRGEIAAVVFVSGQPSRLFSSVPADSGLHFLAVPLTNALAATYLPAELTHASYPNLVAEGAPVPTIAVGSVMAVFAWQPNNERYAKVAQVRRRVLHQISRPPETAAASEMEGREPRGQGARLVTVSPRRRTTWHGRSSPDTPTRPCEASSRRFSPSPASRVR